MEAKFEPSVTKPGETFGASVSEQEQKTITGKKRGRPTKPAEEKITAAQRTKQTRQTASKILFFCSLLESCAYNIFLFFIIDILQNLFTNNVFIKEQNKSCDCVCCRKV